MKNMPILPLLGMIAVVGVFTLDVYLPGMPAMANDFGVPLSRIALTFTGFSVVFAICQLFHGVISDKIGRKPVLLAGLSVAAIATVLCMKAKSYETLLAARLLQATGISVFVVLNAIIRDVYSGAKAIQIRTFVLTVSGISLSIAPSIGAFLQNSFYWQGGFGASLLLILITLIYAAFFYSETHTNRSNSHIKNFIQSCFQLFLNRNYVAHVLQATLTFTVHFTFIILSAPIFMDLMGFTPTTFGYLMFMYGSMYFCSGWISVWCAKKYSIPALIKTGCFFIGTGGVVMSGLLVIIPVKAWLVLVPMGIMTIGITIVRATATTGALAPIPATAGQGAAGLNLVQFMVSAIIATMASAFGEHYIALLALTGITAAMIILILMRLVWLPPCGNTLTNSLAFNKEA